MKSIDELREESNGRTRYLYHEDYWDGPHSGVMLWEGRVAYFRSVGNDVRTLTPWTDEEEIADWKKTCEKERWKYREEDMVEVDYTRTFEVRELSYLDRFTLFVGHKAFELSVGTHTSYDSEGARTVGALKASWLHKIYYKFLTHIVPKYKVSGRIIGSFTSCREC